MSSFIASAEAASDLLSIWFYIARDSEDAANRVQREFRDLFESLGKQPGQGHKIPKYSKSDVLFFPLYSYLVVYRPRPVPIEILAIVHGARQVKRVLKQRNL